MSSRKIKTIYEYDILIEQVGSIETSYSVPSAVFAWLEAEARRLSEEEESAWIRLTQYRGKNAVKVNSYVGVVQVLEDYQLEVLPKIAKANQGDDSHARALLIQMLSSLYDFRYLKTNDANLSSAKMPLMEVFIAEFLRSMEFLVKRGLHRNYKTHQDNLFALRGKLLVGQHLKENLVRRDRFYTEHDEFTFDRPVNRLLHSALEQVLSFSTLFENQRRARELSFIFTDIPTSTSIASDMQSLRLGRGMEHYAEAVAWMQLILNGLSPLTGSGIKKAPSLLFPMEYVFEAYVAQQLKKQLQPSHQLKTQKQSQHLVRHGTSKWFRLKPDLLIEKSKKTCLVLDTKWKLLDSSLNDGTRKYGLSQADFYQLYAYGRRYLDGEGDVVLIYPQTKSFDKPLPVFHFDESENFRLWVLPFCLELNQKKHLMLPDESVLGEILRVV